MRTLANSEDLDEINSAGSILLYKRKKILGEKIQVLFGHYIL